MVVGSNPADSGGSYEKVGSIAMGDHLLVVCSNGVTESSAN